MTSFRMKAELLKETLITKKASHQDEEDTEDGGCVSREYLRAELFVIRVEGSGGLQMLRD